MHLPHDLDYRPLRFFDAVLIFRIWVKRLRLIAVRVGLVALIVWAGVFIWQHPEFHDVSTGGGGTIDLGSVFAAIFVYWLLTIIGTALAWMRFASANRLVVQTAEESAELTGRTSFLRHFSIGMMPIKMGGWLFGAQLYKEGGVIRWREYHADLWLRYRLEDSYNLPHMVLDARPRDKQKAANIHARLAGLQEFTPEGQAGKEYRIFAESGHQSDALVIFTPDVLALLLDKLPGVDVELNGRDVWFVLRNPRLQTSSAENFIVGVDAVSSKLEKQLGSLTGKRTPVN